MVLCLVGEQPIPNLLPVRFLKPQETLLVHTNLQASQQSARRLAGLIENARLFSIGDGYRIPGIVEKLRQAVGKQDEVVINLTGGTKPMALAAFELARQCRFPVVYYQTEGPRGRDQKSLIYLYRFTGEGELYLDPEYPQSVPPLITLDDYLKAHLDNYQVKGPSQDSGGELERAIARVLGEYVDESLQGVVPGGVKDQAEIDLLIRCGNHVGVLEIKTGGSGSGKKAVDQLTTIAAREYLGTYAARFLVTQTSMEDRYKPLAQALRVTVIELREYRPGRDLSQNDKVRLLQGIAQSIPIRQEGV